MDFIKITDFYFKEEQIFFNMFVTWNCSFCFLAIKEKWWL